MRTNRLISSTILLLLLFLAGGCAQKPWKEPLEDKELQATRGLVLEEEARQADCSCCIDAEISAKWDSRIYDGGLNGYLQVYLPSSFKLVAINPLGQPLFALATNGVRFQSINAVKGVYKYGKVSSFVARHSLPQNVVHEEWGLWLSGRMQFTGEQLTELRRDAEGRGVWLTVDKKKDKHFSKEYLLFDLSQKLILQRVIFDKKGNEVAQVLYNKWTHASGCSQPTSIEIVGTSFATNVSIELKNILADKKFSKDTFFLKLPPGYLQQYYP